MILALCGSAETMKTSNTMLPANRILCSRSLAVQAARCPRGPATTLIREMLFDTLCTATFLHLENIAMKTKVGLSHEPK